MSSRDMQYQDQDWHRSSRRRDRDDYDRYGCENSRYPSESDWRSRDREEWDRGQSQP